MNSFEDYPTLEKHLYERPDHYAGETFEGTVTLYAHHRDSDLLTESNWAALLRIAGDSEHVFVASASHWAVGWLDTLQLKPSAPDELKQEFEDALNALADYSVLDDSDFSEREFEQVLSYWDGWQTLEDGKPDYWALRMRLDTLKMYNEHTYAGGEIPLLAIRHPLHVLSERFPSFEQYVHDVAVQG